MENPCPNSSVVAAASLSLNIKATPTNSIIKNYADGLGCAHHIDKPLQLLRVSCSWLPVPD